MMFRYWVIPFLALQFLIPTPAWSQADEDTCKSKTVDLNEKIAACTRLAQDPSAPLSTRVWALKSRGLAYRAKGDEAMAQADFKRAYEFQVMEEEGGTSPQGEFSVPAELDGVGLAYKGAVAAVYHGKPFNFTPGSQRFVAGIADRLLSHCDLPTDEAQKARVAYFVNNAAQAAAPEGGATYLAGAEFATTLDCSSPVAAQLAAGLAQTLTVNTRDPMSGRFVASCSSKFSAEQCECIASLGQGVIPGIRKIEYSSSVIHHINKTNPVIALQIGSVCRITNY